MNSGSMAREHPSGWLCGYGALSSKGEEGVHRHSMGDNPEWALPPLSFES